MGTQGSKSDQKSRQVGSSRKDDRAAKFYRRICGGGSHDFVTRRQIVEYFPEYSKSLIVRLFGGSGQQDDILSQEKFVAVLDNILSLSSSSSQVAFYVELFCGTESLDEHDVEVFLHTAFTLFVVTSGVSPNVTPLDQDATTLLAHTIQSKETGRTAVDWLDKNCPDLVAGMHAWLIGQITETDSFDSAGDAHYSMSDHEGTVLSVGMWWALSSSLPSLYTQPNTSTQTSTTSDQSTAQKPSSAGKQPWSLLYSSKEHGLSVNRLQHHAFSYRGPTVLVISCEGGHLYAVALDTEWREGTSPWGGPNCLAIKLAPEYTILEEGGNMVLFNDKSRNLPRGLFIGRDPKNRVLSISEGLQSATIQGTTVNVTDAEVWGCGSSDVKLAQAKEKKRELKDAERNAKVKLPGQWDDNPDRLLLGWGTARTDYAEGFREDRKEDK